MKKIILLLSIIFPLSVKAASVSLSCPREIKSGAEFSCTLYSPNNIKIEGKIIVPNNFEYLGTKAISPAEDQSDDKNLLIINTAMGETAKINFRAPDTDIKISETVKIEEVKYSQGDSEPIELGTLTSNIAINAKTTTTTAVTKIFTVKFNANGGTGNYEDKTCETKSSSCVIELNKINNPTKEGYTFGGWGSTKECSSGNKNEYKAKKDTTLYACWIKNNEDKTTTTTTTTQTTTEPTNSLYLKNLSIENYELNFSKFKKEYELKVLYEVEKLKITAVPANENIKVEYNQEESLEVGENIITIKLTRDDVTDTYTIKVKRLEEGEQITSLSSDATLKTINIEGYKLSFSPTTTAYNLSIKNTVDKLNITTIKNDEKSNVVILYNENLKDGSVINIEVEAEDGTLNTYKINITKLSFIETYQKYLLIGAGTILLILIIVIILDKKKKSPKVPKTTVVKKAPTKNTKPVKKAETKPEVLKM